MNESAGSGTASRRPRAVAVRLFVYMVSGATLLAGCAVGPDFHQPPPPKTDEYYHPDDGNSSADDQTTQTGKEAGAAAAKAESNALQVGAELPGQWWQLFKSPVLDETLKLALSGSPTLAEATATLAQAREQVLAAQGAFYPHASGSAGVQHSTSSPATGAFPKSTQYTVGLSASYALDVFGGTRRTVEQQRALAEMQRYQLAAAYLTLTGSVVNNALTIASARLQIATTEDLIANDRRNLALTQREYELGAAARTDVLTAESQLASELTPLPSLRQQLGAARDALTVLIGRAPADWKSPDFDLEQFALPSQIPVSLPSRLVRQRPDVLASESQLHSATAAVGVAVAQEFPSITLSGAVSRAALSAGGLFHQFDSESSASGGLTAPLFEGGTLRAQARAARDALDAATASYKAVVLEALGQVADDLRALDNDAARLAVSQRAMNIAMDSLKLQRLSYTAGKSTVLQLIDAERTYGQAKLSYATAQIQQYEDTADLLVALGGGWWKDPAEG
jgi:NodT family efflux transporter outer membrane factor (OMF) lipoprotein